MIASLWQAVWQSFLSGSFWYPLAFICFALGTLIPAALVALSKNIVHAALWLLPCLVSVAGLYLLLGAELLAAIQILVYCGGIVVLILFAIMLTHGVGDPDVRVHNQQLLWGVVAAMGVAGLILRLLTQEAWQVASSPPPADVTGRLADALMGPYLLAFEVVSVILLAALIGAIVIARGESPAQEPQDPLGSAEGRPGGSEGKE
jgi:NADH-quinone oxidoreductase subunit J